MPPNKEQGLIRRLFRLLKDVYLKLTTRTIDFNKHYIIMHLAHFTKM